LLDPSLYRTIVESLIYLTITRPYITFVVHVVSQFCCFFHCCSFGSCSLYYTISSSTVFHSLLLPTTSSSELRAYFDPDHGSDPIYHKSVTVFYIFLGNFIIYGKSKKQYIVSQSSTEVEYHAMTSTIKESLLFSSYFYVL